MRPAKATSWRQLSSIMRANVARKKLFQLSKELSRSDLRGSEAEVALSLGGSLAQMIERASARARALD